MPVPHRKSLESLRSLPPGLEVWSDPERLEAYAHDEAFRGATAPLAVVFPKNTPEVASIILWARKERMPVIPRGAGSGLSGAAVAISEALVVSLERMNRILEIDEGDGVAVVEPGVITAEIRKAVEAKGLFYPPIPASIDLCTIGGNIATNAGGLCAVKYGVTREYVLGLEVVLPTGDVIETGGRFVKNSTGYNLTQLIVGSEGTLGIVTKIIVKLIPLPKERATLLVPFDSLKTVSAAVVDILGARILPPTLELIPKAAVGCVLARNSTLRFPFPEHAASLLIELDSRDGSALDPQVERLASVLSKTQAADPVLATTSSQRDELWNVRKNIRDSVANSGEYEEADSVVPRRRVPELADAAQEVAAAHGLEVVCYGHAGDGNLHTYFRRGSVSKDEWKARSKGALAEFLRRTIALGGTISGEHGIGILKRDFLPMALSKAQIDLMRRIKRAFDPDNLLNPGKVLPL
ncbi:MAG: FAD-linked oxidase C-terminal domain-containing protein [Pseudomonadota bacterium]